MLLEIEHLVSDIENKNRFIDQLEEKLMYHLNCVPYSRSMLSVKGVGPVTIAGLIGEVGDFGKFKTVSEIMKLAGFNLYEVSSGKHSGQHHISKRGRSMMRKLLFLAAIGTVRSNGIMHKKYHDMLDRGMPRVKALVAIARDLCTTLSFAQFWSLRGARRRGNLVAYQCVMRLLRFARNDNTEVMQRSQHVGSCAFSLPLLVIIWCIAMDYNEIHKITLAG